MGGGGLKFLGFNLPFDVARDNEPNPPHDKQSGTGYCVLCKRLRTVTYQRWDGERVCRQDIDDTMRVLSKRRVFRSRSVASGTPVEIKEPMEPWDRQRIWDRWFS